MRLLLCLSLGCCLALGPTGAWSADPRVRTLTYASGEVYRLTGLTRTALQVIFGAGETIEQVALGDGEAWEVLAEGGLLFLRPLKIARPTNLIVTTRKGGLERHYVFELRIRTGELDQAEATFQVRFRYPQDEKAALEAALGLKAQDLERQIIALKLDRAALEGRRNLAYSRQGAVALAPSEISDNGRLTLLRFPGNQPLPVLYAVDEAGVESLTPFDVRGEFVVVHAVHRQLRLRRGRQVLCLYNEAFEASGRNGGQLTVSPDVARTLRGEQVR